MTDLIAALPGAKDFVKWFGRWPSFHDAEVLRVSLDRSHESVLEINVFQMTDEINSKGHYGFVNHAKLRFILYDVTTCELSGFNRQNVIDDLDITRSEDGYQMRLFPIYGVDGSITAKTIVITFEPGIPKGSVYSS